MDQIEEDEHMLTLVVTTLNEKDLLKPATTSSKITLIQGIPWCLVAVSPEFSSNSQDKKLQTLGVFLKCTYDSPKESWEVTAHATIKLLNHANLEKSYSKVFDHNFSQKSSDWGYSSFMKWKDVIDPTKGFVKHGSITLVSQVKVIRSTIKDGENTYIPITSVLSVLSCPICHDNFQATGKMQPMSLICGHSFCLDCLQKRCSKDDVGTIKICCFLCSKDNCSMSRFLRKSKNFCDIHQCERTYYCFDDNILVCIYCAYHGEHSQHKCLQVDVARDEVDKDLQKYKLQVLHKLSDVERRISLRTDEREILQSQKSVIANAVMNFYAELTSTLTKQKNSLLEELDTHTTNMDSDIEHSLCALKDTGSKIKLSLEQYTKWQGLDPHEALNTASTIKCTLQSAGMSDMNVHVNDIPNVVSKITLEMPSLSVLNSVEHLGKLKFENITAPIDMLALSNDKVITCTSPETMTDEPDTEPSAKRRKEF